MESKNDALKVISEKLEIMNLQLTSRGKPDKNAVLAADLLVRGYRNPFCGVISI